VLPEAPAPARIEPATLASAQASTDSQLVDLWLHGRGAHTRRAHRSDVDRLVGFVGKPLRAITLADLQHSADSLGHLAPSSKVRTLAGVKSLLSCGHRLGYLTFDVGRALRLPTLRNKLAERILDQASVHRIIALEGDRRDRAMLLLFYAAGVRVSELVAMTWRDLQPRDQAGQLTVYGKGGKTRAIVLPPRPSAAVVELREGAGGHLDPSQARRIVAKAARQAGLDLKVGPHWLRHAHASHALDRGAAIHLVQATLGHASVATTGRYLHARPTESGGKYPAA